MKKEEILQVFFRLWSSVDIAGLDTMIDDAFRDCSKKTLLGFIESLVSSYEEGSIRNPDSDVSEKEVANIKKMLKL